MPRVIEYDTRRQRIAEAVCALADRRGLEGISFREVAQEAGLSIGAVQRCFATKDDMLVFTLRHIGSGLLARARADGADLDSVARDFALLDEERRGAARVWLTFVAQASVDPTLAATLRSSYADLRSMFTRLIAESTGAVDARPRAGALLAMMDGLTVHVLFGHLTAGEAAEILRDHLRRC